MSVSRVLNVFHVAFVYGTVQTVLDLVVKV